MAINALQSVLRGATGKELQFTGDFHAYWDQLGIPPGQFAERMAAWKALPQNAAWIDATADADAADVVGGLWGNGEQGVWYDPSDLSTMFQGAAGTLPVYAPGQGQVDPPVGRILDKSGRGNHAYQTTTTSRPTLSARYNQLTGTESLATQSVPVVATAYTLTTAGPGSVTLSGAASGTYTAGRRMVTCTAGALTLTVLGSVTQADLRPANDGVGLPAYQRVVDANTYDTVGFPLYLRPDGVDDWMQVPGLDLSASSQALVAFAIRKLSDAAVGELLGFSATPNTSAGAFGVLAPPGTNSPRIEVSAFAVGNGYVQIASAAPESAVFSALINLGVATVAEGKVVVRKNGAAASPLATGAGAGTATLGNYTLYLFRRGGTSFPFNGRLYSLIIRGAATPDTTIAKAERYLNQKARIY